MPVTFMSISLSSMSVSAMSVTSAEGTRGMYVSPRRAPASAAKIVSTAWSRLSRNRVMSVVVMVTGPPRLICSWNKGITEPRDAKTFPYRTAMYLVCFESRFARTNNRSCTAFVIPITLTGLHALSVETPTTVSTLSPASRIARIMFSAPMMLVCTAS